MSGLEIRFEIRKGDFLLSADLSLPSRGIAAIFGPSGCGKTTLLRVLAGLEVPKAATLRLGETAWQEGAKAVAPHRRNIGYVFQDARLFPHMDVRRNIAYGMRRCETPRSASELDELIEMLGLTPLLNRTPRGLSGGEAQRVAIARALATRPRLLLLDEPLAALDHERKEEIVPYLKRLGEVLDIPILLVSHAPAEVARLADHLVVMQAGAVVADGPIAQVLGRIDLPIRLGEDAGAVFDATVVSVDAQDSLLELSMGGQTVHVRDSGHRVNDRVRVRILARDVSLSRTKQEGSSILNHLQAKVEAIGEDDHPAQALVRLSLAGEPMLSRLTHRSLRQLGIETGQDIWAQVKTMAVLG